jgi:ClpP class serine protease
VGVFAIHVDESEAIEKAGIKPTFISAGKYKVEGNPYEPLSDEAEANAQEVVDEHYATFTSDVAAGRGIPVERVRKGFGEGRMVSSGKAVEEGMADVVATFEGVVSAMVRDKAIPSALALTVSPNVEDEPTRTLTGKSGSQDARSTTEREAYRLLADLAK